MLGGGLWVVGWVVFVVWCVVCLYVCVLGFGFWVLGGVCWVLGGVCVFGVFLVDRPRRGDSTQESIKRQKKALPSDPEHVMKGTGHYAETKQQENTSKGGQVSLPWV